MHIDSEFVIIGAGIAGLTTAISLKRLNRSYLIFDKASELKGIGAGFGLAANAMQALEILDLKDDIERIGFYTKSYHILDKKGKVLLNPDTKKLKQKYNQDNFTVHRADLHLSLLSKLDCNEVHLKKKAIQFKKNQDFITVFFEDGSHVTCKYLLIADGVKSPLRQQLLPNSTPRYAGYTCFRAVIDNSKIQLTAGSETWGGQGRFGMTPLQGNRIYWYACINSLENNKKYTKYSVKDLLKHFKDYHAIIPEILSQTRDENLIWNDIVDIKPLKNFAYENILLLGDAAHATTPNMGQGACQAIEDVAVLIDELKCNVDVQQAFKAFEKRRLKRTKYITNTSKQIGDISQWENPFLISLRDSIMKLLPARIAQYKLTELLSIDFMKINK